MSTEQSTELKQALAEMLQGVAEAGRVSWDFLGDQVPLVIQELLMFYTVIHGLWFMLSVGVMYGLRRLYVLRWRPWLADGDQGPRHALVLIPCTVGTCFGIVAMANLHYLLMITLAPRLYVLDYARDLLSG